MLQKMNLTAKGQKPSCRDVHVSEMTTMRRLNSTGLMVRKFACGPKLTMPHRVNRLTFSRVHISLEFRALEQYMDFVMINKGL